MIAVKIVRPIYIRKGPGRSFDYLAPIYPSGKDIIMDGIEKGESWKGIDDWYFKINDKGEKQRYWAGGVSGSAADLIAKVQLPNAQQYINDHYSNGKLTGTLDYNYLLNLDENIKSTQGKGVKVVILDSPVSKNIAFRNPVRRPMNVDHPADDHGSFIAGIIAGYSNIIGIASNVEIIELPIKDQNGAGPDFLVLQAFEYLKSTEELMIVNISYDLGIKYADLFNGLRNKIIVAAAGSNKALQDQTIIFPASLPDVISVGCISKEYAALISNTSLNNRLDFILPDFNYASFSLENNGFGNDNGDSYSCAIVSSAIALLLSAGKITRDMNLNEVRQQVAGISMSWFDKDKFDILNIITPKS
ncbi:S8/S53 family peptidase [Chitinophaga sp. MM2321]|uniref:S8 family peptidase n=1 Tax=Chitinophaga sp. MM2321 TaxID=3137178 RepID=UPI0032D5B11D